MARSRLVSPRNSNARQESILELISADGRIAVEELAERFAVTPQTIRRDLNELAAARRLTRVHGGAIVASGIENLAYDVRRDTASEAKERIGAVAASMIEHGSSLFINLGTTTEAVARALARHTGLLVVTNNFNVAGALYANEGIKVIMAGGSMRSSDGGIVGQAAAAAMSGFKMDLAVIGTSAIDEEGVLLDYDVREVQVSRAIIENARRVMLVADAGKFARLAPIRIARMSEIDLLVTDRLPTPRAAALCRDSKVEVVEVLA